MLLLLHLIGLSGVAFGQFFNGHPLSAARPRALSPFGSGAGDSESLPISQEELAHLMAQSLASSPTNYGRKPAPAYRQQQRENIPNDDFAANYDAADEGAVEAPQQPDEYPSNEGQEGQQEAGEGSPYQQEAHSEGQDESQYQQPGEPQQTYRENSGGYESPSHNYQQEGEQYQSGQYPDTQSSPYGQSGEGNQESNSESDEEKRGHFEPSSQGQSYGPQSGSNRYQSDSPNKEYDSSAAPHSSRYSYDPDSYSAPGSGYSEPGSESFLSYVVRPKSKHYPN